MADVLNSGQIPFFKKGVVAYDKWRSDFGTYMSRKGLQRYCDGTARYPSPADESNLTRDERLDLEKYDDCISKASGEILSAVEESVRGLLEDLKGKPKDMLAALDVKYDQKVPGVRFKSYNEFFSISLPTDVAPELVLPQLVDNVKLALADIRRQRPATFDIDDLEDELASMVTLRALRGSDQEGHRTLAQQYSLKDQLAFSELEDAAVRDFSTKPPTVKQEETDIALAMAAGFVGPCFLCEGPHGVRDCPNLETAKTNLKNTEKPPRGGRQRGRGGAGKAAEPAPQPAATAKRAVSVETAGQVHLHI